jgi:replicative DNA helicase
MDEERALISKLISTGRIDHAIVKGVDVTHFADDECRQMYDYLLTHLRKYSAPPSIDAIKADKPAWEFHHSDDALDYLLDRFIGIVKRRFAQDAAVELARRADDPDSGETIDLQFLEVSRQLALLVPSTQVARFKDMGKRITDYEQTKAEDRKIGIPFGFRSLDAWTGGIQQHEFVTVAGFSGLGKSTLLMVLAYNMWVQGITPLFITLEMEHKAILRRFDAMATGIDYWRLKHMDLAEDALDDWRATAEKISHRACDIPVIDSIRGCTPDHIHAETIRHQPDVVFIDYLSLMRSSRPSRNASVWQTLGEITQDLKQSARTLGVPIIAAAQTNRSGDKEGAELANIGYSISVVQDSDIVIGLYADDEMREQKRMEIRLIKNRDGKIGTFSAVWDHEHQNFREAVMKDLFKRDDG